MHVVLVKITDYVQMFCCFALGMLTMLHVFRCCREVKHKKTVVPIFGLHQPVF